MARLAHNLHFQRPSPLSLESKQRMADDDEFGVLDDTILDSASSDMSLRQPNRRESLADSTSTFSPHENTWPDYSYHFARGDPKPSNNATHQFIQPNGLPFARANGTNGALYGQQAPSWPLDGASGSCTPTPVYDAFQTNYEGQPAMSYSNGGLQPINPNPFGDPPMQAASAFQSNGSLSTSPQSGKDWMSSGSEQAELRSLPKRIRPESPDYHHNSPLLLDGIRKKNARFEIPAERNLRTIDHLITQTNDEQEIKELKQQKRLLRNRQAALDSRQRKKQHTERLEEEKKYYTTTISDLEERLLEISNREAEWTREKETWLSQQQQCQQYIDSLMMEKEEMVRSHTIETGELRKKNNFLTEQVQRLESTAMSAAPSSTGFSTDFSDFDNLTMDNSPWDNISFVNDFSIEADQPETSLVVLPKKEKSTPNVDDKSAASGLLLMLLLCGAWVASNRTPGLSASIPSMPEDIRMASAAVLHTIYEDAGVQPVIPSNGIDNDAHRVKTSHSKRKTTLSAAEIASLSRSPLESLHTQLITPSEEQQRSQMFSLSAEQYNNLASDDYLEDQKPPDISNRRNLGEALAAMSRNAQGSAAEIYTRSLLWSKLDADVVRDFSRMVAECNADNIRQGEPLN